MDGVLAKVCGIAGQQCEPGVLVTPHSTLNGDLGLDSVALMSVIIAIETEYGIQIGGEDIAAGVLETPATLGEFIRSKQ